MAMLRMFLQSQLKGNENCINTGQQMSGLVDQCIYSFSGFYFDRETEVDVEYFSFNETTGESKLEKDMGTLKVYGIYNVKHATEDGADVRKNYLKIRPRTEEAKKSMYFAGAMSFMYITEREGYDRQANETYVRSYTGEVHLVPGDQTIFPAKKGDTITYQSGSGYLTVSWVNKESKAIESAYIQEGTSYTIQEDNMYSLGMELEDWFGTTHIDTGNKSIAWVKLTGPDGVRVISKAPLAGIEPLYAPPSINDANTSNTSNTSNTPVVIEQDKKYLIGILVLSCVGTLGTVGLLSIFLLAGLCKRSPLEKDTAPLDRTTLV